MVWLIVILGVIAVLVIAVIVLYNRLRPAAQPRRQRVGADRGAAQAALGPDPEPRRDGQGLRGPRARDVRGRHGGAGERAAGERHRRDRPAAEGLLSQALGRLFAVAEAYPELQADENFRQLQTELAETENRIAVSRQVYNDTVLTFNNAIQTFPGVLSQASFGFTQREFFEIEDDAQREVPRVDFSPDRRRRVGGRGRRGRSVE